MLQATKVTSFFYTLDKSIMILRMLQHYYEPTLPLKPPQRAITAIVVRAHYIQTGGLVIVVVVHHRRHRPPPPPPSPSRGWLLLGAA